MTKSLSPSRLLLVLLGSSLLCGEAVAAPGDQVAQIPLPNPCANGPFGLAFDGLLSYFMFQT